MSLQFVSCFMNEMILEEVFLAISLRIWAHCGGGRIELPLLRRKKWRESFYGSLGRCLKGDPQQEVNGHHSGSLDCTVVDQGSFKNF